MELLTLAGIVTIVITGALTRIGEMALDGSIDQLKRLIQRKSPDTFKKLEAAADDPKALPETIEVMATLIEEDTEIKQIAETVAKENQSQPYVVNMMEKVTGEIKQIGLENIEANELEAEIEQEIKEQTTANKIDQIGTTGIKISGKATIKIKQDI